MSALSEILDLPPEVKKSDFVVQLTDGIAHPEQLLGSYAVTEDLLRAFDDSLKHVQGALRDRRSTAAYVHGSFGSGKSHFMAVLSLMLANDPTPWKHKELHPVLARHEWLKQRKVLRLHLNMAAARSLDDKVFPEYLQRVQALHPEAPLPGLFADQALFDNAEALRKSIGDALFFAKLNEGQPAKKGWGKLAEQWTPERFAEAVRSAQPEVRERLLTALVRSHFPAFAKQSQSFLDFDSGLGVLARHAAGLGYDAVVLFFDELILWLSSLAGDRVRLNGEVQKLSKLVDAQDMRREIPLCSFVARQRDIAELVGDQYAGADAHILQDALRLWEGRFGKITLDDKNLPAVIEKRVVRPRDEAARKRLEQAFVELRRRLGTAWGTLLGDKGDEKAFRQVYPFSPALVEVLVSMSHYLQRQRTALKLLMEMLTEHMQDFEIGKVVPVGDLYDVLAGSEEPLDGVMRDRFAAAKRLYQNELLPAIQAENGTQTPARCQRLREAHPVTLGCANCREEACRADNRLVKTALVAALVPQVPVLQGLTVLKLVQLNHGSLKVPIPGAEASRAAVRLGKLAAAVGKLRVGEQADPSVRIELGGVELKPILDQARYYDNQGPRRRKLQRILFSRLGIEAEATPVEHEVTWRNTKRRGLLHFGNVREMEDALLRARPDDDFKVVIDYPFDEKGHSPDEDEARLVAFRGRGETTPTVVWLPSFFGDELQKQLGELVVIDEVLADQKKHLGSLRPDDQKNARLELESMSSKLRHQLALALDAAYGLSSATAGLDPARSIDKHFHVLIPGLEIRNLLTAKLDEALDQSIGRLLDLRFPRHPNFQELASRARLEKNLLQFRRLVETDGQRLPAERGGEHKDLSLLSALGLVALTDAAAVLQPRRLQEIDTLLLQRGLASPTVDEVREGLDRDKAQGLQTDVEDLLILAYAAWSGRELVLRGSALTEVRLGALPPEAELRRPALPEQTAWQTALDRAGKLFGVTLGGRALNGRNLRELSRLMAEARERTLRASAMQIPALLARWALLCAPDAARAQTAQQVASLLDALSTTDAVQAVGVLAGLDLSAGASLEAMARHMAHAAAMVSCLQDELLSTSLLGLVEEAGAAARALAAQARAALEADELQTELAPRLRKLAVEAQRLRAPPPGGPGGDGGFGPTPVPGPPAAGEEVLLEAAGTSLASFDADRRKAEAALRKAGGATRVEVHYTLRVVKPKQ
ncbi:MAG: hypothetical protein U1A78_16775 [Polyangia bacterium]